MAKVVKFPTNYEGHDDGGKWLAGYAAGLADAKRCGADVDELLKESGLTIYDFEKAGADEYDLEEIKAALSE